MGVAALLGDGVTIAGAGGGVVTAFGKEVPSEPLTDGAFCVIGSETGAGARGPGTGVAMLLAAGVTIADAGAVAGTKVGAEAPAGGFAGVELGVVGSETCVGAPAALGAGVAVLGKTAGSAGTGTDVVTAFGE